jgi:rSAM/selenodomain-associated transferase 2
MTISVIIPVLLEQTVINDTLDRLLAMPAGDSIEVIVVDGSPQGETVGAITTSCLRVKGVLSPKGRGKQMNAGAAAATGEVLLFLHADTALPESGLDDISGVIRAGRCVVGAFDLGIADDSPVFRVIERISSLRSRLTRVPYGDQALFVKSDYFRQLGGFAEFPLMEDVDFMRRVKKSGGKISFIGRRVQTSSRRWRKEGIVRCTLRNWTIILLFLCGARPERLAKWYQ